MKSHEFSLAAVEKCVSADEKLVQSHRDRIQAAFTEMMKAVMGISKGRRNEISMSGHLTKQTNSKIVASADMAKFYENIRDEISWDA